MLNSRFLSLILGLSLAATLHAADPASPETRLREALRNTMLQARDLQNQLATQQAAQTELEKDKAKLQAQLDAQGKQAIADKTTIAGLSDKITAQEKQIAAANDALAKWKAGYAELANVAKQKEAQRAKLASDNVLLQRRVDDQQRKNATMYQLGTEILKRYEHFGLGDALTAREPFVQTTRVKLENLVQDYSDKLADQKITPQ